ncbi:MAG: MBL fold metallo-hydrolase [Lentisphaeria bacterium]|nr:MBL fold metallo-hydrolase [Lentisphaeria bacterium]NQZ68612.1 MBL fold metallo-hydrolase [Lentisphaeria bacterium]
MNWTAISDSIRVYSNDSCNVYAVNAPDGVILFNAGSGAALENLDSLGWDCSRLHVVMTHYFRDHTSAAVKFKESGASLYAPYWEQHYLQDPDQHFRERQIWNSYDNRWDRYSPVEALDIDEWMMDYGSHRIAGLDIYVQPTSGVSTAASSYLTTIDGQRIAFVGELIHSPGKIARLAPLQYNYNDYTGAYNVYVSCQELAAQKPDILLPSLGDAMTEPQTALSQLQENLKRLADIQPAMKGTFTDLDEDDLIEFIPNRLYKSKNSNCVTNFLISSSGKVMSLDYGYRLIAFAGSYDFATRRPALHGISGLKKRFGKETIDAVLISHFHDDHVNGIPMLQRLFGTEVLACENFVDILQCPMAYDRPCLWPEPINVDRSIPAGETIQWEEFTITCIPMSGHTRFAALLCIEFDNERLIHTGDQVFFSGGSSMGFDGADNQQFTNHVYKNGLDMGSYKDSYENIKAFMPTWVATGHTDPYPVTDGFFDALEKGGNAFDDVHQALMPLSDNAVHFGAESQGGKLQPYHAHYPKAQAMKFRGWVLNPYPTVQTAELTITAPAGWTSETVTIELGPREQKNIALTLTAPANTSCRRLPVGLSLTVGNRPFGQVAEALVTIAYKFH